jgi:hypothetical protein
MNTKQESKLKMYLAVRDFLAPNDAVTKDLPEFPASFTAFQSNIKQIQLIGEAQKEVKTGLAKDKKELRKTLIMLSADNSRKVFAYAKITNNKALMDEVNFSISDLGRMTEVALKDYAEILYKKAEANIESLTSFGITPESQKILAEAIRVYDISLPKPRIGISQIAQATKELGLLFDATDSILVKMDVITGIIRLTQVNFYNGYKTVRKLVDTNTGNISLKATATDLLSGERVKGVLFIFKADGIKMALSGGNGEITKKTADKGSFHLKNMLAGTYKVVVRKPGYKEKEVTVSIADGERSYLNVELEKV